MLMKFVQFTAFMAGVFCNIYFKWTPNPNVAAGIGVGFAFAVYAPVLLYHKINVWLIRRRIAARNLRAVFYN